MRNSVIGVSAVGVIGLSGYGVLKLGSHLKSKHDAKKEREKENLLPTM
ncbi:hypothetical protein [Neobacillus niacini]|nr:hypothetical protein [Neobacillus niacini]